MLLFTVIVAIIIAIICYCKHLQKRNTSNATQSGGLIMTNVSAKAVELEGNPAYATVRKTTANVYKEVNTSASSTYMPLLKNKDGTNLPHSRQEITNFMHSDTEEDAQDPEYDYID